MIVILIYNKMVTFAAGGHLFHHMNVILQSSVYEYYPAPLKGVKWVGCWSALWNVPIDRFGCLVAVDSLLGGVEAYLLLLLCEVWNSNRRLSSCNSCLKCVLYGRIGFLVMIT